MDMEPLASLDQLKDRLEFDLSPGEERIANGALESLSEDARYYAGIAWSGPAAAPRQAINTVLKAAARFMRNPDAYTQSRAGDETLAWTDRGEDSGEAHFTTREIAVLRSLGDKPALYSAQVTAWRTDPDKYAYVGGYVPVSDPTAGPPFRLFNVDGSPW